MVQELPDLQWGPSIAIGDSLVDAQHQRLFEAFNAAVRGHAHGMVQADADALMAELIVYAREHFRDEAALMRRLPIDPAHRDMHLRAHARFEAFLGEARAVAGEQPVDVMLDVITFLGQWLLHHVAGVDAQLGHHIQALASGDPTPAGDLSQLRMAEAVNQLTETLVQRSFDLLRQRQQLANLQKLHRALLHSGDVLIQSRSEQEMLDSLCSKIVQETLFHAAWIGRPGADRPMFDVLALFGEGVAQVHAARPRLTREYESSMTVRAWTGEQLLYSNDTLADPLLAHWHEGLAQNRWLSALAVPIKRGGNIWGVLTLGSPRRGTFDEQTVEACARIAALLGHGLDELDLKARIQSLQRAESTLARTDALTGLPNRLAIEEYVPRAIERARRHGAGLAIGLLDLDDFKNINDRYGHEAGDALLRDFALRLRGGIRGGDFVARLGGDEFVCVLDDLGPDDDAATIEAGLSRLHATIETPFELGAGAQATVGMTLGLALYPHDATTVGELLRRADAAMYRAKLRKHDREAWWCFAGAAA